MLHFLFLSHWINIDIKRFASLRIADLQAYMTQRKDTLYLHAVATPIRVRYIILHEVEYHLTCVGNLMQLVLLPFESFYTTMIHHSKQEKIPPFASVTLIGI